MTRSECVTRVTDAPVDDDDDARACRGLLDGIDRVCGLQYFEPLQRGGAEV